MVSLYIDLVLEGSNNLILFYPEKEEFDPKKNGPFSAGERFLRVQSK
jgi:hypothetical protein